MKTKLLQSKLIRQVKNMMVVGMAVMASGTLARSENQAQSEQNATPFSVQNRAAPPYLMQIWSDEGGHLFSIAHRKNNDDQKQMLVADAAQLCKDSAPFNQRLAPILKLKSDLERLRAEAISAGQNAGACHREIDALEQTKAEIAETGVPSEDNLAVIRKRLEDLERHKRFSDQALKDFPAVRQERLESAKEWSHAVCGRFERGIYQGAHPDLIFDEATKKCVASKIYSDGGYIKNGGKVYYSLDGIIYPIDQLGGRCANQLPADSYGRRADAAVDASHLVVDGIRLKAGHRIGDDMPCVLPKKYVLNRFREVRQFTATLPVLQSNGSDLLYDDLQNALGVCDGISSANQHPYTPCLAVEARPNGQFALLLGRQDMERTTNAAGDHRYSMDDLGSLNQDTGRPTTIFVSTSWVHSDCPGGFFSAGQGNEHACAPCPSGTFSGPGAVGLASCRACEIGHVNRWSKNYHSVAASIADLELPDTKVENLEVNARDVLIATHNASVERQACGHVPAFEKATEASDGTVYRYALKAGSCDITRHHDAFLNHVTGNSRCSAAYTLVETIEPKKSSSGGIFGDIWNTVKSAFVPSNMRSSMAGIEKVAEIAIKEAAKKVMWLMKHVLKPLFNFGCKHIIGNATIGRALKPFTDKRGTKFCAPKCSRLSAGLALKIPKLGVFVAAAVAPKCMWGCKKVFNAMIENAVGAATGADKPVTNFCGMLGDTIFGD